MLWPCYKINRLLNHDMYTCIWLKETKLNICCNDLLYMPFFVARRNSVDALISINKIDILMLRYPVSFLHFLELLP